MDDDKKIGTLGKEFIKEFMDLLRKHMEFPNDEELLYDDSVVLLSLAVPTASGGTFLVKEIPDLNPLDYYSLAFAHKVVLNLFQDILEDEDLQQLMNVAYGSRVVEDATYALSSQLLLLKNREQDVEKEIDNLLNGENGD